MQPWKEEEEEETLFYLWIKSDADNKTKHVHIIILSNLSIQSPNLRIDVLGHDGWPSAEDFGKERLSMFSDERGQTSDIFDAADIERHRAAVGRRLLRTRSLVVRVESVSGMLMRHRRISLRTQHVKST